MMLINEQIALGGTTVPGFQLVGVGEEPARKRPYKAGEQWVLNIYADRPVTSEQFIDLATEIQSEPLKVIKFEPITDQHFRALVEWTGSGETTTRFVEEWDGVVYTTTVSPVGEEEVLEEKKLSTGAMVGIGAVVVGTAAGIAYAATRKKRSKRRS